MAIAPVGPPPKPNKLENVEESKLEYKEIDFPSSNDDKYHGQVNAAGRMHGKGKYWYGTANNDFDNWYGTGDEYEGEWFNGVMQGKGSYKFKEKKDYYDGEWI